MQRLVATSLVCLALAACASAPRNADNGTPQAAPSATAAVATAEKPRTVKSRDGSYDGEIVGVAAPNSGFSKIQIGMNADEINALMGRTPDRSHFYESGKRWIPFYYGNDARRMQVLFEGEGCLIYAAGNRFNRTSPDLIRMEIDPKGTCYQP